MTDALDQDGREQHRRGNGMARLGPEEVDRIVAALGGVNARDAARAGTAPLLEGFVAGRGLRLDDTFADFTSRYGNAWFAQWITFVPKERVPIAPKGNVCSLGTVHGWQEAEDDIPRVQARYADQIADDYLPFADGSSGDLLCIAVAGERPGAVWYWHHESPEEEDLFLVADDFASFLRGLRVQPEVERPKPVFVGEVSEDEEFWRSLGGQPPARGEE